MFFFYIALGTKPGRFGDLERVFWLGVSVVGRFRSISVVWRRDSSCLAGSSAWISNGSSARSSSSSTNSSGRNKTFSVVCSELCAGICRHVYIYHAQEKLPQKTLPPKTCFPCFFGRFAFQSIDQNPLLGPARAT
jgi:hypothetical protein